jgi:hypothetical protein
LQSYNYPPTNQPVPADSKVLLQLVVYYGDGTVQTVVTGKGWKT